MEKQSMKEKKYRKFIKNFKKYLNNYSVQLKSQTKKNIAEKEH